MSADNQQERFLISLNPDYVTGLIDGEGYFSVYAHQRVQKTWMAREVKFTFGVKLKEADGIVILNSLQKFFQCGFVYFRKDERTNFCNCYEFQVNTHKEVFSKIIPFFQKYPLKFPSKLHAFEQFVKIARMVQLKEHLQVGGIEKIQQLAQMMH